MGAYFCGWRWIREDGPFFISLRESAPLHYAWRPSGSAASPTKNAPKGTFFVGEDGFREVIPYLRTYRTNRKTIKAATVIQIIEFIINAENIRFTWIVLN